MARIKLKDYLKTHHKSYISHKIERADFIKYLQNMRTAYTQILEAIKTNETEENIKNIVINFIKDTFYSGRNDIQINAFQRIDYAVKKNNNIEVIMEFKKPSNTAEMITHDNLNKKALHEAIKYFYDEKYNGNYHIKNIIISDGISYYIFNPSQFQHKSLEKLCYDSIEGDLYLQKTKEIYKEISNIIDRENITFEFAWFDLRYLEKRIKDFDLNNVDINDKAIRTLLYVYKLFHPDFLLNEYSPKDSNQLNRKFYDELLYILGLEEVSENNKKLIKPNPNSNGLINETIKQLEEQKDITDETAINIAFELIITWLNRILFLKLFESQLVSFNDNKNFKFITSDKITDFDELNKLFFSILGKKFEDRDNEDANINIPYLNSSLFEKSEMELKYINITALNNNRKLALYKSSNLKHWSEYKNKTEEKILKYLLDFLDSYDFSSGASENLLTEENRDIINSAVLGLIFEKLNGYKDGSFYTPGFITEYMAKTSIEKAVIDKFNNTFDDLKAQSIQEIRNYIGNVYSADNAQKYNDIINSLRICDPAVGSGHFLVSVLNYIIYLKSYLGILFDDEGNKISNNIEIFDDTLVIFNQNDVPYAYKRNDKTTYQVQKALFKEKRTIIENCLFAVDINPKSVYICQLRLWIELLKNTYYIDNTNNMEVLPNIDINIKTGNSLVSKYPVQIGKAITQQGSKEQKEYIKQYKQLVAEYKNSGDKETKKKINQTLKEIKSKLYSVVEGVLVAETKEQKNINKEIQKLEKQKKKATTIDELKKIDEKIAKLQKETQILVLGDSFDNPIYQNSMEWMLEFPEILDEDGKFQGFDVVVGNPPYISHDHFSHDEKKYYKEHYNTFNPFADIYCYFIERAISLQAPKGILCQITSNSYLKADYGVPLREYIRLNNCINSIINIEEFQAFESATVNTSILISSSYMQNHDAYIVNKKMSSKTQFNDFILDNRFQYPQSAFTSKNWPLVPPEILKIKNKMDTQGISLEKLQTKIRLGIATGDNNAFIINEKQRQDFITKDSNNSKLIKPILRGRDIKKYNYTFPNLYILLTKNGIDVRNEYPTVFEYLDNLGSKFKNRGAQGQHWTNLRACSFFDDFKSQKIIWIELTDEGKFALCNDEIYLLNSAYFLIPPAEIDAKYLLGILNSKIIKFYLCLIAETSGVGTTRWINNYVKEFPIPLASKNEQLSISNLVEEIHKKKNLDTPVDTSYEETKINQLVYELYNLTEEEIKIVENNG